MRFASLALFAPLLAASPLSNRDASSNPTYDGYHIYTVTPRSVEEAREFGDRFSRYHTHPIRDALSVAVPPEEVASFQALGLKARLVNNDLGEYIRSVEEPARSSLHKRGELPDLSWFDTYHDYNDHLTFWDDLVSAFPKNSEKFEIGKSYENRSIYAFHLHGDEQKNGYNRTEKPVILWHATVHAREVS